jgi:hypothetical protein
LDSIEGEGRVAQPVPEGVADVPVKRALYGSISGDSSDVLITLDAGRSGPATVMPFWCCGGVSASGKTYPVG